MEILIYVNTLIWDWWSRTNK